MGEVQKYSLKEELTKVDELLTDSPALYGMSALTYPRYCNSMRSVMFTSHLKQFLTPLEPDFPFVFTNVENLVGEHSDAYKRVKNNSTVFRKIVKFDDIIDDPKIYTLFLFDDKLKRFDVVTRKEVEDLTENFGYSYNNEVIDSLEEDDKIKEGTVLFKSTSYDENMNYRFGKNVTVMYTLDPYTSEDAAVVSKSFADNFTTIETEKISVKLNDNDFLINMYGKHGEYKPIPDIGQIIPHGPFCAIRTQFNDQILYDFKSDNLNKIHDGDRLVFTTGSGNAEIVDIIIYNNNEELVETPFNSQVYKYLYSQNKYYKEIYETCEEIIESGYEYSQEIDYLYKRSKEMIDVEKRWKEGDSAFSDMVIEFSVRKIRHLNKGQKITGRYGNKSVISMIRPDEEMPYTKDGKRVDLLLNLLAIVNRTTSFAIYELIITSICKQVRERMASLKTYKQKEILLFDILNDFNEKEYEYMKSVYDKKDDKEKKRIIDDAIKNGIYINISPVHETEALFYRIQRILNKYDWLQPSEVYVNKNGVPVKTLSKHWIGTMYILKLKQSDFRGFSVRGSGAIDIKGLPTRSYKSKNHMEKHSDSAIRFGEFETLNFSIGVPPEDIALFNLLYRTSIKGREDLVKWMFKFDSDNPTVTRAKIDNSYSSRVAEIFGVLCKSLGIGIYFENSDNELNGYDNENVKIHELNGTTVLCTDYEFMLKQRRESVKEEILEENLIMSAEALEAEIERRLHLKRYINGPYYGDDE